MKTEQLADLAEVADDLETQAHALLGRAKVVREILEEAGWHVNGNGRNGHSNGNGTHTIAIVPPADDPEPIAEPERTVGRLGTVTKDIAARTARVLGTFARSEFDAKLGLKPVQSQRWLTGLVRDGTLRYEAGEYVCTLKPSIEDWVIGHEEPFSPQDAAEACGLEPDEAVERIEALRSRRVIVPSQVEGTSGLFQYNPVEPGTWPPRHPTKAPPERDRPSYELAPVRGEPVRQSAGSKVTRRQRSTEGAGGIKGHKQRDRRYKELQAAKEKRAAEQSAKDKAKYQPRGGRKKRGSVPVT